ncbi:hypothetical protein PoB_000574700 [Plakobranchus ocellatus]|uniref:60S ribosomal protein L6 n=1 Tax=Plakobranchus ocellatus TaxID=259542 RepID=A0AAV3Y9X3_9GAST|nr:hypothetical protein PoB_000574700 [Plakobranchus ocellatus]
MQNSEVTAAEVSVLKGCKTFVTKSVTCVPKGCKLFITGKGIGILKRLKAKLPYSQVIPNQKLQQQLRKTKCMKKTKKTDEMVLAKEKTLGSGGLLAGRPTLANWQDIQERGRKETRIYICFTLTVAAVCQA